MVARIGAAGADLPLTVEALADLQAGLLDDDRLPHGCARQVRADPHARQTILRAEPGAPRYRRHWCRRDVGARRCARGRRRDRRDAARPADPGRVPAGRCAPPPPRPSPPLDAGGRRRGRFGRGRRRGLAGNRRPDHGTGPDAEQADHRRAHHRVTPADDGAAIASQQILALLDDSPEYGPLGRPASRRASCLSGLGYPASTQVLGARPIEINARPGVLLVLPADTPRSNLAVWRWRRLAAPADTGPAG